MLDLPFVDLPQNLELPHRYPSMDEALNWSTDFYEAGFWGIDELGNRLFRSENEVYSRWRKVGRGVFKYALGLGCSFKSVIRVERRFAFRFPRSACLLYSRFNI